MRIFRRSTDPVEHVLLRLSKAAILDGQTDVLASYQAEAGPVVTRPAALELLNSWWSLAEIAEYVDLFRRPHTDSRDTRKSWQILTQYLPGQFSRAR